MRSVVPMKTAKIGCIGVSLILFLVGVFLLIDPAEYGRAIGMAEGIMNFITMATTVKIVKHQYSDRIDDEMEYREL